MMQTLRNLLNMIKFPHTVFALPFALMGALLAAKGLPPADKLFWIVVAMVGARTAAMTFNRIVDTDLDARNPRTDNREMPKGIVTNKQAAIMVLVSIALFEWAAFSLNRLCFLLSPVALLVILGYSFTKRFTKYSHLVLGLSLALAPIGAWIAVRGSVSLPIVILGMAVLFWVAGFDILYGIQDIEFDKGTGLYSIPRYFGVRTSLIIARIFHLLTFGILFLVYFLLGLGGYYLIGLFVVGALLIYEHSIISEKDLSRLNMAFFNMNGYISVTIFGFTFLDMIL